MSVTNNFRQLVRLSSLSSFKRSLSVSTNKLHQAVQKEQAISQDDEKDTHFGFTTVKENEKVKKVYDVFETVASKYDLMNDAMSFGIHRLWKDIFIDKMAPCPDTKLLDVAGGTGDISFRYINYLINLHDKEKVDISKAHVTVCDINAHMLEVGKKRAENLKIDPKIISWKEGNGEELPFLNEEFSVYTIAFGIRNVTHIDKVLKEAYRVLVPGGRFMCLEFSQVNNEVLRYIYDQYSFQIIPVMGQLLAGQWQPYKYLVESIRKFPNQEDFKTMIEQAGFRCVTYENLTGGIVAIHSGFKI